MVSKHEKKSGKLAWAAWTAAVVFYLYEYAVRVTPSIMEHELAVEFSVSSAALATALGSYYFIYSPMQLFVGILFDKFGGKIVLLPATVLVMLGCLLPAIPSQSLIYIATGRILAGLGSSCAFIGVMYLAAVWFHDHRLAFLSGLATSLGILGALLGQNLLSSLVDGVGWRIAFLCLVVAGSITTIIVALFIPKPPHWERERRSKLSDVSFRHFSKGLISVVKNKQTWVIGLVASCLYMPTIAFGDLWGVRYIQCSLEIPKLQAARVAGMLYLGWMVGGPIAGILSDMIGCRRRLLIWGCFLSTVLFLIILLSPIRSAVAIGTVLFFAGIACSPQVVCFVASLEINKSSAKGSAIAVINMIVMLVGGIFQPIVGWLMDLLSTSQISCALESESFRYALLTMPALTLIGFALSFLIKKGINVND